MNNNSIFLDEIFSFVREKGPVMVAVSGGSDSMAALFLANAWARQSGREIHAVTVDHGLRAEAAAEAAFVAMVCDGLDIIHTTLAWDAIKPVAGISAAARHARYDLMEEFAEDIGVRIIITGHTLDDQAETVLMRLRRSSVSPNSSGRGHSGMCRRTLLGGGTLLLRPFLQLSRQRLRAYLNEVSQSWIEDSSNHDESYERVRVRRELAHRPELKRRLLDYSSLIGRMREVVSIGAAKLLMQCCKCNPGHVFVLDTGQLRQAPGPVTAMALKTVIATAGGGQYLVSDLQLQQVLGTMGQQRTNRVTLGNCVIEGNNRQLQIYRENRNLNSSILEDGESALWDGRLHINNDTREDIRIEPMSLEYLAACANNEGPHYQQLRAARKSVLLSSPLITTGSGLSIPLYFDKSRLPAQLDVRTGARGIENFCPEWDFALLEWLKSIDLDADQHNISLSAGPKI
jgi:tRNA(Ile)-lysidine synthase